MPLFILFFISAQWVFPCGLVSLRVGFFGFCFLWFVWFLIPPQLVFLFICGFVSLVFCFFVFWFLDFVLVSVSSGAVFFCFSFFGI